LQLKGLNMFLAPLTKHHRMALISAVLLLNVLSGDDAQAGDCQLYESAVAEARAQGDLTKVQTEIDALDRSIGVCSAFEIEIIRRNAALAYYDKAILPGLSDAERVDLLSKGLKLAEPWKMSATLADIEFAKRNFAKAAELYQNALDDMRDESANPEPPPQATIATIVKRAEQASLLSPVYVPRINKRSGQPGGLAEPNTRGFVAKKAAVPVQFNFRETTFTEAGLKAVEDMSHYLKQQGVSEIRLVGHTDPRGSRAFNQRLSEERAKAVAEYLKSHGFSGEIETAGRGEDEPYKDDGSLVLTEEERYQLDRRVELERGAD
jgi:outer membrane protein OmpA-like peptidoglycan-associated protein